MIKFLLWIWQIPQHLIALFILSLNLKNKTSKTLSGIKVYFVKNGVFGCGVSLGNYILLHKKYYGSEAILNVYTTKIAKHEHGHSIQSKIFGPLYLILVGIPSALGNLYDRLFHKNWTNTERSDWYYSRYPENWADKLGGVTWSF